MVEIREKLRLSGNSYCFRIRKALVDAKVFEPGKTYVFELKEVIDAVGGFLTRGFCKGVGNENIL